jgi:hypothetical protein
LFISWRVLSLALSVAAMAIIDVIVKRRKIMHLFLTPILAFADPGVANSGAVVIVLLSVAALIRSKMP